MYFLYSCPYVLQCVMHDIILGSLVSKNNYNSMKFQSCAPATDQLIQLSQSLMRQHCIISIPAIILMVASFFIISLLIPSPHQPTSPEFTLPSLLSMHYKYSVDYVEFFLGFAAQLMELEVNGSLTEIDTKYGGIQIGMSCILGDPADCNKFAVLSNIIWQYKSNPHLHMIINHVIICDKSTVTCVATRCFNNLSPHQFSLINSTLQLTNLSPFTKYIDNTTYIVTHNTNIIVVAKLRTNNQIITKIMQHIPTTIQYYSLSIIHPCQKVIVQYNPNNLLVSSLIIQDEDVAVDFKHGVPAFKFVVRVSRIEEELYCITQLSFFACLVFIIFAVKTQRSSISDWVNYNFSRITLIKKLYSYTIRDIFTGIKPSISNILQRGPAAGLFQTLSELVDKSIVQIEQEQKVIISKDGFRFHSIINEIIEKYKVSIKGNMEAKNKYILANRFNLQTYINDLCESQSKIIRDYYVRAQELDILEQFFRFAYLSILKSRQQFFYFLQEDEAALPNKLAEYFIKINQNIHQADTIYDKLDIFGDEDMEVNDGNNSRNPPTTSNIEDGSYIEQNKQQLQFRVRVYIIPKYLTILKELDSKNNYAQKLGLDRQLRSLNEIVDNTRYLLARHNKSIRNYCK